MPAGPIRQATVDIVRLIGRLIVGAEPASAGKVSRAERKGKGAAETRRASRELFAGSAMVGTVAVLIVGSFAMQARGAAPQRIETLRPADTVVLRGALFGAAPLVVECTGVSSGVSVLREAAAQRLLPAGLRAASLECDTPLAGGSSTFKRFGVPRGSSSAPPTLLLAGNGQAAPTSVPRSQLRSAATLVRYLKRWMAPQMPIVNSTLDLRRHCLSRPACLLLLTTGTAPSSARALVFGSVGTSHRQLGVATLNRRTHVASFSSQIPDTTRPVLIALRAAAAPLSAEARAFRGAISPDNQPEIDGFVATAARGEGDFIRLEAPPRVTVVAKRGGGGAGGGLSEDLGSEELFDPLLSNKRWEMETAL